MDAPGGNGRGSESSTARVIAPLALLLMTVVVIVVISSSIGGSDENQRERRDRSERVETECQPTAEDAIRDGYYVVEPGEPGLSSVADKTCVPVEELQELNPNLDPQLIPQGACVDLRPDGCKALAEG